MVDFACALQAGSAGLALLRELSLVTNEYDKGSLKLKIAELSGALAKVQIALGEAHTEAAAKDAEIARLLSNFKEKQELFEHDGFHYRQSANGEPEGNPYCPRCLQKGYLDDDGAHYKTWASRAVPRM